MFYNFNQSLFISITTDIRENPTVISSTLTIKLKLVFNTFRKFYFYAPLYNKSEISQLFIFSIYYSRSYELGCNDDSNATRYIFTNFFVLNKNDFFMDQNLIIILLRAVSFRSSLEVEVEVFPCSFYAMCMHNHQH